MSELVNRQTTIKNDFLRMTPEIETQLQELEMRSVKIDFIKVFVRSTSFLVIGISFFLMFLGWYVSPNDTIESIDIPPQIDSHFSYSQGERLVKAVREYTFTHETDKQREESLNQFEGELRNHKLDDVAVSYVVSQMLQGRSANNSLSASEKATLKEKVDILKEAAGKRNDITLSPNVMLILENRIYGHPESSLAIEYEKSAATKMRVCKIIEYILIAAGVLGIVGSLVLSLINGLIRRRLSRIKPLYKLK